MRAVSVLAFALLPLSIPSPAASAQAAPNDTLALLETAVLLMTIEPIEFPGRWNSISTKQVGIEGKTLLLDPEFRDEHRPADSSSSEPLMRALAATL
jgi:hypothetical protein